MNVLEHAQWYARQGIFVNAVQPNSKALLSTGDVLASATRDPDRIEQLFVEHPDRNVGVVPGPASDLLVIDVDVKNGARGRAALKELQKRCGALPSTYHEITPSGGEHFHYHLNGAAVPNGKLEIGGWKGIEIFGSPHNVVVAPSTINGKAYTAKPTEIVVLPQKTIEYLLSCRVTKSDIGQPKTEGRNNGMYREACRLRHYNEPEAEAWNKLLALNQTLCTPPLDKGELKKLFKSAWNQPPGYMLTDLGNAERFLDRHGDDLRFVKETEKWLHWDGLRWVSDDTLLTVQMMKDEMRRAYVAAVEMPSDSQSRGDHLKWAKQSESRKLINAALALAPNSYTNIVTQAMLDADPWLFATRNAILDLRTGRDVKANRAHLITKCANVDYDPSAICPTFLQFFEKVQPNANVRNFIQHYFGYALTGDTREQCLLICWGTGANGKSTLLDLMRELAGDYGMQAMTSTWLQKRGDGIPNDVAALAGKRLVISTEFDEGARVALSLLKSVTGGEALAARFLYGEVFNFKPQFKIAFGTNHKLVIDGGSLATRRRIRLVEFNVTIPDAEMDKTLPERLRTELPGILNWLIEGCLQWQRDDGLGVPDEVRKATADYAVDNDQIGLWVGDRCETGDGFEELTTKLYNNYKWWCETNGTRPKSHANFRQALADHGFGLVRTNAARLTKGLRLVPDAKEPTCDY